MPNIRQLEYFVALADTLNFRRAAERTYTTQPTLSEQLKAMEERLGAQLIERSRSRVMLTPIGNQVLAIARRILSDAREIEELTASGGKELKGVLRLGLPPTVGPYLLPLVLPELHKTYPELKLYLREELPDVLPRSLEDGALDCIITLLPIHAADFVVTELFREPLYLVVGADHELAQRGVAHREDLVGRDMLALGRGHQLHDVVTGMCEEMGARVRMDFEGTSLDTLREMVVMGLGMTFLPGLYVRREIRNDPTVKVLELHGRSVHLNVGMAWRKSSVRQHTYEALACFFKAAVRNELADLAKGI